MLHAVVALLASHSHVAPVAHETGPVRLLLLSRSMVEHVTVLAFIVGLLVSDGLIYAMPGIALAAWRHHDVLILILVEYLLVLVLQ